jgi:homoserine kinase type II
MTATSPELFSALHRILARYGLAVDEAETTPVGSGFSGADVWRVATSVGPLCVRRWPSEHPTPDRLAWIHGRLRVAFDAGCVFVPAPMADRDGWTVIVESGRLWEVTPWMPGRPELASTPSAELVIAALDALAKFHRAMTSQSGPVQPAPSPGLADRLDRLDRGLAGEVDLLRRCDVPAVWHALDSRRAKFLDLFPRVAVAIRPAVVAAAAMPVPMLPCIRDIRREHVLFTANVVSGWVDFGAMRDEAPAADVARVLGEFVDDRSEWPRFTAEYVAVSQLALAHDSVAERVGTSAGASTAAKYGDLFASERTLLRLIQAFDQTGTLLSPYNWFRWILVEGRDFADRRAVVERLDRLLVRLRRMASTL